MTQPTPQEFLPADPGHVMRRDYYERMAREAEQQPTEKEVA